MFSHLNGKTAKKVFCFQFCSICICVCRRVLTSHFNQNPSIHALGMPPHWYQSTPIWLRRSLLGTGSYIRLYFPHHFLMLWWSTTTSIHPWHPTAPFSQSCQVCHLSGTMLTGDDGTNFWRHLKSSSWWWCFLQHGIFLCAILVLGRVQVVISEEKNMFLHLPNNPTWAWICSSNHVNWAQLGKRGTSNKGWGRVMLF